MAYPVIQGPTIPTSDAYIWPSSPQPATAFTAAQRTKGDLSLNNLPNERWPGLRYRFIGEIYHT